MGFFDKIKEGLAKTKKAMANTLDAIFIGGEIDDDFYEELTDCLILADLGVNTATKAVERLRAVAREKRMQTTEEAREYLKMILAEMLYIDDTALQLRTKPSVVLVIGVNGVGKTTTIADRHDAGIIIRDPQRFQKISVRGVADQGICHKRKRLIDAFLIYVNPHHLMVHIKQLF